MLGEEIVAVPVWQGGDIKSINSLKFKRDSNMSPVRFPTCFVGWIPILNPETRQTYFTNQLRLLMLENLSSEDEN